MKKHFLLIALLTVVFLGLGSYSYAICEATTTAHSSEVRTPHFFSCEATNAATNAACNDYAPNGPQTCYPATVAGDSCSTYCCICTRSIEDASALDSPDDLSSSTDIPPAGDELVSEECPKPNTHLNTLGACVCNDGYKDVAGVCKPCSAPGVCCGVELNTNIPFIGKCIEDIATNQGSDETTVTGATAFPVLAGSLTKILVTVILIVSFVLIIIGGIMIAVGKPAEGKKLIMKVVVGIALLGASGVILRLINPNFFG